MSIEYPYVAVPDKMLEFLEKLRTVGIPEKATSKWLESLGYKSSNDRSMLRVLSFIGFIDSSGTPLDFWKRYRSANYRQVLANAVFESYQELFSLYPEAHQCDDTSLEDFFSTKTKGGKQVISRLVRTFKTLATLADFTNLQHSTLSYSEEEIPTELPLKEPITSSDRFEIPNHKKILPQITFNIQVVLPENASPEIYDSIFKSIAENLLT